MARYTVAAFMLFGLVFCLAEGRVNSPVIESQIVRKSGSFRQSTDDISVTFEIDYKVTFGHGFVIAGNISKLGNWDPTAAQLMNITNESIWTLTLDLPVGEAIEYKPVLVVYDTKQPLEWANGNNYVLVVPNESLLVLVPWTGSTLKQSFE